MPNIVKVQMSRKDFRQHPAMESCEPHWLLSAIYGRHLAKSKLRQMHPELSVRMIRYQPEYERLLDSAIDVLELRDWAQPRTVAERLMALHWVLRMTMQIDGSTNPATL